MMSGVDDIGHMITHHLKWEFIGDPDFGFLYLAAAFTHSQD